MKEKILYTAIIGFLGFVVQGCTDGPEFPENNPEKYITFTAPQLDFSFSEGSFSRAEIVTDIEEFTVWGYCVPRNSSNELNYNNAPSNWQAKSKFFSGGPDVLDGNTVTVDGSNTSYDKNNILSTSNPREWYKGTESGATGTNPNNYNYGFIAASSTSGTFEMRSNSEVPGEAYPVLNFNLGRSGNDLSAKLDPAEQPDALIGTKFDQRNNSTVMLTFKHIMTGLRFRFHNETSDATLTIHKVTFSGIFYNSCDFSFEDEQWQGTVNANDMYSGTFELLNNDQTIAPSSSDLMYHGGDTANQPVKLLLLPNPNATLTPDEVEINNCALGLNKQITIEYSFGSGSHKTFTTGENFHLSYIPDANTLHTANFHFTGSDFVVTFVPDNNSMWQDGSNSNLEIH